MSGLNCNYSFLVKFLSHESNFSPFLLGLFSGVLLVLFCISVASSMFLLSDFLPTLVCHLLCPAWLICSFFLWGLVFLDFSSELVLLVDNFVSGDRRECDNLA